ncbi:MAG: hypothetical protein IKM43_04055 [Clostridia bacterium]|nr:hypothetical protein [Clostridia bacterium]
MKDTKTPKLDALYEYFGLRKNNPTHEIIQNHNEKSVASIVSKIKRKVDIAGITQYKFVDIKDLARCAVLFHNFAEISQFLHFLSQETTSLRGDISRNDTGYKGIHLNFDIEGVCAEIQLSTFNAWLYKTAAEKFYIKWRDRDVSKELELLIEAKADYDDTLKRYQENPSKDLEILLTQKLVLLKKLREEYKDKNALYKKELKLERDAFEELYSNCDFTEMEIELEAVLFTLSLSSDVFTKNDTENEKKNKKILSKSIPLNSDLSVDEEKLLLIAEEVSKIASSVQIELMNFVKRCFKSYKTTDKISINNNFEKIFKLIKEVLLEYDEKLHKQIKNKEFLLRNIKHFYNQRTQIVKEIVKYAKGKSCLDCEPKEIIKLFFEKLSSKDDFSITKLQERLQNQEHIYLYNAQSVNGENNEVGQ